MISPHGNELVDRCVSSDREIELLDQIDDLQTITLDAQLVYDFANIAHGVYSPLRGFMSRNDFLKVVNDKTLESGEAWPLPIVLDVDAALANDLDPDERVGICREDGSPIGIMDIDMIYKYNQDEVCKLLQMNTKKGWIQRSNAN
jgi:sulfate adenylyltransferase